MIEIRPLDPSQYRQVAEWEFGKQEGVDWARYEREMNAPKWAHFALYSDAEFIGCLSLEGIDQQMLAFHVVTARRKIHPSILAQVLLNSARNLFNHGGFTAMVARIPKDKRAAARLAIRCGMREWGRTPALRYFMLTKTRFQKWEQANPSL